MRTKFKRYLLSVLAIILLGQMPIMADESEQSVGGVIVVNIIPQPRTILPNCYYCNGIVYIECAESVTGIACTVTRFEDNLRWNNRVVGNNLQILTSSDCGLYSVTFTLSNGDSFYGEFQIP